MVTSMVTQVTFKGGKMRRLWILLTIPLILGCIGGEGGIFGSEEEIDFAGCVPEVPDGLVVTSFQPDLAEIFSDEGVTLTLELGNLGESKATGIEAEILNSGVLKPKAGETIIQTVSDMDVQAVDMPPVSDQADWELVTDGIGTAGSEIEAPAASVSFDYVSFGNAMVKFLPRDEWRQMRQDGETVEVPQTCSNGPLAVSVEPLKAPITEDSGEFTTRVILKNIGSGKAKTGELDMLGTITLDLPTGLTTGSVCDFADDGNGNLVATGKKLNRDGELTLTCKLALDEDAVSIVREADYEVKADVEYRYVVDSSTSVTVTEGVTSLSTAIVSPTDGADWNYDTTMTVEVNPIRNGESICNAADLDKDDFEATIKNDMTSTIVLNIDSIVKANCDTKLGIVLDWPASADTKLFPDDAVLALELDYNGKKASVLVEGVDVNPMELDLESKTVTEPWVSTATLTMAVEPKYDGTIVSDTTKDQYSAKMYNATNDEFKYDLTINSLTWDGTDEEADIVIAHPGAGATEWPYYVILTLGYEDETIAVSSGDIQVTTLP